MSKFHSKIKNEYANEYTSEYAKSNRGCYTKPKIYDAGGDLTKRWYVYFSYLNPNTGQMQRQAPLYMNINRIKNLSERKKAIKELRNTVEIALENGLNPYGKSIENKQITTISQAIVQATEQAKNTLKETSFKDFSYRVQQFEKWLLFHQLSSKSVNEITKKTVMAYLSDVLERTSAKNRNNTRANLNMLFKFLEENDLIKENFIPKIPVLKATPERNKTYTKAQEEAIFTTLAQTDKQLLLFVKFVSYNFLRPIEVCRLQIKHIDFKEKQLFFEAKNSPLKTKIIPEILFKEIAHLQNTPADYFLFTPNGVGAWEAAETNKRDYWSKRFKRVVKNELGLGADYGLYSFRHTFITKLYRELRKIYTPYETKSRLMLITGHTSMEALNKYLRDIDAELPTDYSELLE